MKNKMIILLVVCICFAIPMSSQTIDSTVNDKVKAVKDCSTDLLSDLQLSKTQELYPKEFKKIISYLDKSKSLIGKINNKNLVSKNMKFVDQAIKNYNNARRIHNELIKKELGKRKLFSRLNLR